VWEYTNKKKIYIYITVGFGKKHQSITRIFSTLSYWKILMDNKVLKELFSTLSYWEEIHWKMLMNYEKKIVMITYKLYLKKIIFD
jgi:hypothetical protein